MLDNEAVEQGSSPPVPENLQSESVSRLTTALKSLCPTRDDKALAVSILVRNLFSGALDQKIPIPGPQKTVLAYLVPPGTRLPSQLTPERIAELQRLSESRAVTVK